MEPFRHLVERTALSALQRHEFSRNDFFTAADGGCRLETAARRAYLAKLIERFNTPLAAHGETVAATPLQHIHWQNQSLIGWLLRNEPFQAWRTR